MDKKEIDEAVKRTVKEYGGTLKALGVDSEAERIIRADERAKIRAWAFDHILLNVPKEETMVRGYDKAFKEMVAFLDSLDSPSKDSNE